MPVRIMGQAAAPGNHRGATRYTGEVFCSEPWVDMHNRMKEALVLLGKLPRATKVA
jgi:hypothetical protein